MDQNQNEFAPDSPEIYQQDAALNTSAEVPAAPTDEIGDEPAAGDAPLPPVAPVAPAAPVAPVAVADFNARTPIPGLREEADNSVEGIALATKIKLSKQPKVRMMIPLDPGEKAGAYRTVVINGYRFDVRKNTMVDLPESVAALLADAYAITNDVLENNPLNLAHADASKRGALGMG